MRRRGIIVYLLVVFIKVDRMSKAIVFKQYVTSDNPDPGLFDERKPETGNLFV